MSDARIETSALLVAGRVLDGYAPTVAHVIALRDLAARHGVSVIVASDETCDGAPSAPAEALHARVAIGVVVAEVTADEELCGPITIAALRAGLAAIAERGALFWKAVAKVVGAGSMPMFSAAERRASLPERLRAGHVGVGFDGPDLAAQPDLVHLVPSGPLSHATLAAGVPGPLPDEDREGWVYGQRSNQDTPSRGVRGVALASADMLGLGSIALDLDALGDRELYLIARYD